MSELDEIADRAQRHLDGMTVNRDAMARDVLKLVRAVRRLSAEVAVTIPQQQRSGRRGEDILRDIFGGF